MSWSSNQHITNCNDFIKAYPWEDVVNLTRRPDRPVAYPVWKLAAEPAAIGFETFIGPVRVFYFIWYTKDGYNVRLTIHNAMYSNTHPYQVFNSFTDTLAYFRNHLETKLLGLVTLEVL